eukprot:PhF_6_TR5126/c0_g1_i2/m.7275
MSTSAEDSAAIDAYQQISVGGALTKDQVKTILRGAMSNTLQPNARSNFIAIITQRIGEVPDAVGETVQALIHIIGNASVPMVQQAAIRSLPVLCKGLTGDVRSRLIRELTDVAMQISMNGGDVLRPVADTTLDQFRGLDAKAVASKMFQWIGESSRLDESDEDVRKAEQDFAFKRLKAYLATPLEADLLREILGMVQEKLVQCSNAQQVAGLWRAIRGTKVFDEREAQRTITNLMADGKYFQYVVELLLLEPNLSKRLDGEAVSAFIISKFPTLPVDVSVRTLQALASLSPSFNDAASEVVLPCVVSRLVSALPADGSLPSNFSLVEVLLGLLCVCARKASIVTLKLVENRNSGEPLELFTRLKAFKAAFAPIAAESIYAAKRRALAVDATRNHKVAAACVAQIPLYLEELTKEPPKFAGGLEFSWEHPYVAKKNANKNVQRPESQAKRTKPNEQRGGGGAQRGGGGAQRGGGGA